MPLPNLETGKYAAYIWPAYAITVLVFAAMIAGSLIHAHRWRDKAQGDRAQGERAKGKDRT